MTPRRIIVCCGGRDLRADNLNPEHRARIETIRNALHEAEPTHVIHGNQRGGDNIWHNAIRAYGLPRAKSIPCQEIRVSPTIGLTDETEGMAYADRTRLLWEIAGGLSNALLLWPVSCFALPGGRGTDLCKRLAPEWGAEVLEFDWPWRVGR
jgi:hypothetical protein